MAEIISPFNSFHCFRHISLSPLRREDVSWLEFCVHLARVVLNKVKKHAVVFLVLRYPLALEIFGEKESPTPRSVVPSLLVKGFPVQHAIQNILSIKAHWS